MNRPESFPARLVREYWSLALVLAVYLATLAIMPARGLWMVDNENRFIQIRALADANLQEYAIPWGGRELDPGFEMNPLRFNPEGTFEEFKDGQLISVFQPAFLVLGAVFLKLSGTTGLNLLPIAGAALMLMAVSALAGRLALANRDRHLAVILAGLATPTWFYSQNLWEHTLAAGLCLWGVVGLVDFLHERRTRSLVLACASLVAAVVIRDVLGILVLILMGLLFVRMPGERRRLALVGGAVLGGGALALAAFQWAVVGQPLGFHAGTLAGGGGLAEHLARRPRILYLYLIAAHPQQVLSFVLAAPFLASFVLRPRLSPARTPLVVPLVALAAAAAGAAFLAGFLNAQNTPRHLLAANSFFVAAPLVILGLLRPTLDRRRDTISGTRDFLVTSVCLYLLCYCLVAPWAGAVSLHWGGRLQFCLYPLLTVLAVRAFADWREGGARRPGWAWAAVSGLVVVSIAAQVYSVTIVREKKLYSERLAVAMERMEPDVVITDVWWAGHELYEAFRERTIYFVSSQAQLESLAGRLSARGVTSFVFATRPRPGPAPAGTVRVLDGGWDFYSLDLLVSPIRSGSTQQR